MNQPFLLAITLLILLGCNPTHDSSKAEDEEAAQPPQVEASKPKVSFTFDDGITQDLAAYPFEDWNEMILTALREAKVTSTFFVTGSNKLDEKGQYLLRSWSEQGHQIGNHTYSHPNFNDDKLTVSDFENQLLRTDKIIAKYPGYVKLFRFPYLKEGNNRAKIDGFRNILAQHDYRNGYVSIDASDWYINSELIKSIRKHGEQNAKLDNYKAYYLQHILERAHYYEELSYKLTHRHVQHTLLLHHNLTSALFLGDLIQAFQENGWEVIDAEQAFQDDIYQSQPSTIPAGESIIWSLAKESGQYEDELRYPAEDSRYEIPKMKKLGI